MTVPHSILDLAPVPKGSDAATEHHFVAVASRLRSHELIVKRWGI